MVDGRGEELAKEGGWGLPALDPTPAGGYLQWKIVVLSENDDG